jgi:hypothetical protein
MGHQTVDACYATLFAGPGFADEMDGDRRLGGYLTGDMAEHIYFPLHP